MFPDGSDSLTEFINKYFYCYIYMGKLKENAMKTLVTLPAHYDGKKIVLDTPFNLRPDDKLLITILDPESSVDERKDWIASSLSGLNNAYNEDEPEYSPSLIKEPNPEYNK